MSLSHLFKIIRRSTPASGPVSTFGLEGIICIYHLQTQQNHKTKMLQTLTLVFDTIWVNGKQEIQDANMPFTSELNTGRGYSRLMCHILMLQSIYHTV